MATRLPLIYQDKKKKIENKDNDLGNLIKNNKKIKRNSRN